MKKIQIENGYKYKYRYNQSGCLLQVDFYRRKFFGLLAAHEGKYEFHYNGSELQAQRNYIDHIGLTEAVNYFYENGKLVQKEYYNDKMALRYFIHFRYAENQPVFMEIKRFNGIQEGLCEDSRLISEYLASFGKEVDYLSDMLEFVEKLKKGNG